MSPAQTTRLVRALGTFTALAAAMHAGAALLPASRESGGAKSPPREQPVRRVVIDPGHGGTEEGAIGPGGLKEKDLTLDMAKRLASALEKDGFEVWLTRDDDSTMALDARAAIANQRRADLFIALHANASRFAKAHGAETFFLAQQATDDAARTTAALENDAAGTGGSNAAQNDGELQLILWDMAQNEYLEQSQSLAKIVQENLARALGLENRGVRQAPFRVLVGATCPAVLVELGFITNPDEEKQLAGDPYRVKLTEALLAAVRRYRDERKP